MVLFCDIYRYSVYRSKCKNAKNLVTFVFAW